ncbi:MAG: hypothetical protein JO079_00385 [Frankiaceae bacterium]|nr:hypothetical protein [Frankiaceae bacterium]MBV9369397.1 hypothetical protein [Frankiales bacterium]
MLEPETLLECLITIRNDFLSLPVALYRLLAVGLPPDPELANAVLDQAMHVIADVKMWLADPVRRLMLLDVARAIRRMTQVGDIKPPHGELGGTTYLSLALELLVLEEDPWLPGEVARWMRDAFACGDLAPVRDDDRQGHLRLLGKEVDHSRNDEGHEWSSPTVKGVADYDDLIYRNYPTISISWGGTDPGELDKYPDPNPYEPDDDEGGSETGADDDEPDGPSGGGGGSRPPTPRRPSGDGGSNCYSVEDLAERAAAMFRRVDLANHIGLGRADLLRVRRAIDQLIQDENFDLEAFFAAEYGDRTPMAQNKARRRFKAAAKRLGELADFPLTDIDDQF